MSTMAPSKLLSTAETMPSESPLTNKIALEVLLAIFTAQDTAGDVLSLSATCRSLRNVFVTNTHRILPAVLNREIPGFKGALKLADAQRKALKNPVHAKTPGRTSRHEHFSILSQKIAKVNEHAIELGGINIDNNETRDHALRNCTHRCDQIPTGIANSSISSSLERLRILHVHKNEIARQYRAYKQYMLANDLWIQRGPGEVEDGCWEKSSSKPILIREEDVQRRLANKYWYCANLALTRKGDCWFGPFCSFRRIIQHSGVETLCLVSWYYTCKLRICSIDTG